MSARAVIGVLLAAGALASVVAGVAGGLLRAGVAVTDPAHAGWLVDAALSHAGLMVGGFFATVIGIERAVAAKVRAAWLAPLASAAAGAAWLLGAERLAPLLVLAASAVFVAVNLMLWRRQRAPHTALLLASAVAWCVGNLLLAGGALASSVLPWWFGYLVMTIAAERLEMTRLMRRRAHAQPLLQAVLAGLAVGAAVSGWSAAIGGVVFGACLVALAAWLMVFDVARRTVHAHGLSRYMAVCLLSGYVWLAVGGLAWMAAALGAPARDAALHALGLGFIVSMVMGHAPVILPAIARIKLHFGHFFYAPLVLLHASLAWRLGGPFIDAAARAQGAVLNAAALAAFALTVGFAALAWRHHHAGERPGARLQ